jgi:4-hydroxybenzoate polyprenyltransferase
MNIKQFYCTGLVIPLSTSSMSTVFSILFLNTISILLFACVFLTTYAFYAIDSIVGIEVDKVSHPEGSHFLRKHRTMMCATILLAIVASISISALVSPLIVLLVVIAPAIALMYSGDLPLKHQTGRAFGIKRFPLLKDAFIASGWAFLLPFTFLFLNAPMKAEHWLFAIPLFLKLFVMAIIYDFKDISSDRESEVRTLPIMIGEGPTKTVLHLLNFAATVSILVLVGLTAIPLLGLIFVPAFLYQGLNIHLLHKDAPDWVYYVFADLEQFFWLVFVMIWGLLFGLV